MHSFQILVELITALLQCLVLCCEDHVISVNKLTGRDECDIIRIDIGEPIPILVEDNLLMLICDSFYHSHVP